MSFQLLQTLQEYPEEVDGELSHGRAYICSFSRGGSLLCAASEIDKEVGCLVLWDVQTYNLLYAWLAHAAKITSVSWTVGSRYILTSSLDYTVIKWDIQQFLPDIKHRMGSTVDLCVPHPREQNLALIALHSELPVLLELDSGSRRALPLPSKGNATEVVEGNNSVCYSVGFNRDGTNIVCSAPSGTVYILSTRTLDKLREIRFDTPIEAIKYSADDNYILGVSVRKKGSSSREHIQVYSFRNEELLNPIRNVADGVGFTKATFSIYSEFIIASSRYSDLHTLYVWDVMRGTFEKKLDGPSDGMVDFSIHPRKSDIVSCGKSGTIYIWKARTQESWSAYAPDFIGLEENEIYIEREDEFDVVNRIRDGEVNSDEGENEIVDAFGLDYLSSGDEDESGILVHFHPIPDDLEKR